jgi:hypothetical protein
MMAVELTTGHVSEDPASPMPVGGYIMACAAFYERGFGVPLHQFLRSLLQLYGFKLHHMIPSGILHIVAFVTLCEAYMSIDPHFNLWNYFFCAQLQQGSGAEAAILGGVDIYVRSGHGVDPYFQLPVFGPSDGWWKVCFFFRNDADAPLPVFMGSRL